MQTKMLNKELLAEVKRLSSEAKLILCEEMFSCSLERVGKQYVIYTGFVKDSKLNRVRFMRDEDCDWNNE